MGESGQVGFADVDDGCVGFQGRGAVGGGVVGCCEDGACGEGGEEGWGVLLDDLDLPFPIISTHPLSFPHNRKVSTDLELFIPRSVPPPWHQLHLDLPLTHFHALPQMDARHGAVRGV